MLIMLFSGICFGIVVAWIVHQDRNSSTISEQKRTIDDALTAIHKWEQVSKSWESVARKNEQGWRECLGLVRYSIR